MAEECPKTKCPAGIPAWVMTFADLMSLLMCFFVLLLSFSEMNVIKYKQISGSLKMAFGVQREIKALEIPKGVSIIAKEFSPAPPQPTIINEVRQKTSQETNQELLLVKRIDELEAEESDLTKKLGESESDEEKEEIQEKVSKIQAEIDELKDELEQIKNKISEMQAIEIKKQAMQLSKALKEEINQGVLEIETNTDSFLIRIKDKGAFPAGTAQLSDDFIDVLEVIKKELANIKGGIIVAGHTDNVPINTRAYRSNWDLSAERSVSVVQELLYDSKINPKRISIQAFAESRPLVDNKTPENRSKNRRVEIIVSKSNADELDSMDDANSKEDKNEDKAGKGDKEDQNTLVDKKFEENSKANVESVTASPDEGEKINQTNRPKPDVDDFFNSKEGEQQGQSFINF